MGRGATGGRPGARRGRGPPLLPVPAAWVRSVHGRAGASAEDAAPPLHSCTRGLWARVGAAGAAAGRLARVPQVACKGRGLAPSVRAASWRPGSPGLRPSPSPRTGAWRRGARGRRRQSGLLLSRAELRGRGPRRRCPHRDPCRHPSWRASLLPPPPRSPPPPGPSEGLFPGPESLQPRQTWLSARNGFQRRMLFPPSLVFTEAWTLSRSRFVRLRAGLAGGHRRPLPFTAVFPALVPASHRCANFTANKTK